MKNYFILLTGSLLSGASALFAQTPLSAAGINPLVGETYTEIKTTYVHPGASGAGVTWDFSVFPAGVAVINNCVTVASTAYGSYYPSANIAFSRPGGEAYQKTSSSALQNYGFIASSVSMFEKSYSDPEDILRFPFTFGDTYSDNWGGTWDTTSVVLGRLGTTTVTADGYGTLITPAGTFLNTTRVHFVQNYRDSAIGGSYSINHGCNLYMWYANGYHYPLARMGTVTYFGATDSLGAYVDMYVGISEQEQYSSFRLFPSPAVNNVTISITLEKDQDIQIQVFNMIGQQMQVGYVGKGVPGINNINMDTENMPPGSYFVRVLLDGNVSVTRALIISK
ncbi:MAG: hypothetical protein JWO09_3416 [Bacteroidetes bacterium]|nr:hypothetical protein [Bacteroidota bacterium]